MGTIQVISSFFRHRILQPVLNLLKQGMTPRRLAATVAAGTVIGIVPVLGVTTLLSTAVASRFRLNIAATVLVSYLVQPLQLLLAIPFIRAGVFIFRMSELRLTIDEMVGMFKEDWLDALNNLWLANLAGVAAWAILVLPIGGVLYMLFVPLFRKLLPKPTEAPA